MIKLQSLFSSRTRVKLLQLFLIEPRRPYYLREISKLLGESPTPVRRELLNLIKIGFLKKSKVANLVYYDVNSDFLLYRQLKKIVEKTLYYHEDLSSLKHDNDTELKDIEEKIVQAPYDKRTS